MNQNHILADSPSHLPTAKKTKHREELKALFLVKTAI